MVKACFPENPSVGGRWLALVWPLQPALGMCWPRRPFRHLENSTA